MDTKHSNKFHFSHYGFTLIELLVTFVILGILTAIAIPGFARWLPNYRLKSAARDVYSNMQLARMGAIKANADWAIVFNAGSNSYRVCSDDGGDGDWTDGDEADEKTVSLPDDYKVHLLKDVHSKSGLSYGHGNATTNATVGGGTFPADEISYNPNVAIFTPRGTVNTLGYVYLSNTQGSSYAVGTPTIAGVIILRKWMGTAWE